jgi:hypothetical protein
MAFRLVSSISRAACKDRATSKSLSRRSRQIKPGTPYVTPTTSHPCDDSSVILAQSFSSGSPLSIRYSCETCAMLYSSHFAWIRYEPFHTQGRGVVKFRTARVLVVSSSARTSSFCRSGGTAKTLISISTFASPPRPYQSPSTSLISPVASSSSI